METTTNKQMMPEHYYGDIVRRIFLIGAMVMAVTLPIFNALVNWPLITSLLSIVVLAFLAGLQNPRQRWVIIINALVAVLACVVFEYTAVNYYLQVTSLREPYFWTNQILAVLFLVSVYYSSKTLRGKVIYPSQ